MADFVKVTARQSRRCRAGLCFTDAGEVITRDALDENGWAAIEADPLLTISEVDGDEEDGNDAPEGQEADDAAIDAAIRLLIAPQFDGNGNPRMPALRDTLKPTAPALAASLDVATRDRVFDAMIKGGFTVPAA